MGRQAQAGWLAHSLRLVIVHQTPNGNSSVKYEHGRMCSSFRVQVIERDAAIPVNLQFLRLLHESGGAGAEGE